MKILLILLHFFNLIDNLTCDLSCGSQKFANQFIFGGSVAEHAQFSWIAPLLYISDEKYLCGSTIISAERALTAAHCIRPKHHRRPTPASNLQIIFGGHDLSQQANSNHWQRQRISSIKIHPDWGKSWNKRTGSYDGDIAILKFPSIQFSNFVNKICLPSIGESAYDVRGTIVGYGLSEGKVEIENVPKFVEINSVDQQSCFLHDPMYVMMASSRTFCAGDIGKIPCKGDSGNGFFVKDPLTSRWKIFGIVSAGLLTEDNCDASKYSIFTNVVSFLSWIIENIEPSDDNLKPIQNDTTISRLGFDINRGRIFPANFTREAAPRLSQWSGWSACNATQNTFGYQFRTRICLSGNCSGQRNNETQICYRNWQQNNMRARLGNSRQDLGRRW